MHVGSCCERERYGHGNPRHLWSPDDDERWRFDPKGYARWRATRLLPATTSWGAPTYFDYLIPDHPATARLRRDRAWLASQPPSPERDEALAYADRKLDEFGRGESQARGVALAHHVLRQAEHG